MSRAERSVGQLGRKEVVVPPSSLATIKRLHEASGGTGLDTSEGMLFNHVVWGRDRIITAFDELDHNPEIAHETILVLAKYQGTKYHWASEEEPGRIHNEHRDITNWEASKGMKLGAKAISKLWGGNSMEYTTYFSADSTPLYVSLVKAYVDKAGDKILSEKYIDKDNNELTIMDSVERAIRWIKKRTDQYGLVSAQKKNPVGLFHQTWRDGHNSNPRTDGKIPNIADPIEYLDIQVLSASALSDAASLVRKDRPSLAQKLRRDASMLREKTLEYFWIPDQQYFAIAREQIENGDYKKVETVQSNPGWMLNSDFFDGMHTDRRKYLSGIIRKLFSDEFLTDAGIRTRSLRHADDQPFADYHGSHVSWPVDTYMFAKGLRRQGFNRLAEQLENRVLNYVNMTGVNYELFMVDKDGNVITDVYEATKKKKGETKLPIQMLPEENIAWTTTATARIKRGKDQKYWQEKEDKKQEEKPIDLFPNWQRELEEEILGGIKNISVYKTVDELTRNCPANPGIWISRRAGLRKSAITDIHQLFVIYKGRLRQLFPPKE
jgi:glycogen debranching enzyme